MSEEVITKNIQEYLEALYILTRKNETATVGQLSEFLAVAPASVTEMLKKLSDKGFVTYSPYHGASLSKSGLKIGAKVSRKHRLLERFLHDVLKINRDKVHQQACEMEHSLSDEAERALCQLLGHPSKCPDDNKPIQPCDLLFSNCEECQRLKGTGLEQVGKREENLVSLVDLKERSKGKVAFIRGDQKVLRRLLDMGLTPNTVIQVVKVAPLDGPVEIAVRGARLALGREIASDIFVDASKDALEKVKA